MSASSTSARTGRDVLPPAKRKRAQAEPAPPPTVVVVQRPDHEARTWADLALASASELEERLAQEHAAHQATTAQLESERAAHHAAVERAEAAEASLAVAKDKLVEDRLTLRALTERAEAAERSVADLRARVEEDAASLDRALSERWRLEEELASMTERANAAEAQRTQLEHSRRVVGKELANRDIAIAGLQARLDTSNTALHRFADQRNKAVLENTLLTERIDLLNAQLERIRDAAR